jgi:hypothetical protein
MISLGFTLIIGVLLFVYIRQKTSNIEDKVEVLFQLVKDEAEKQHNRELENQRNISMTMGGIQEGIVVEDKVLTEAESELIEVSSDSDSSVTTNELESDSSDDESVTEEEEEEESSSESIKYHSTDSSVHEEEESDSESIKYHSTDSSDDEESVQSSSSSVLETPHEIKEIILATPKLDIEELSSEEVDEEIPMNSNSQKMINLFNKAIKLDNSDNKSVSSINTSNDTMNYRKTPVAKLREIATERGVENPKNIKKLDLVKLLIEMDKKEQEEIMNSEESNELGDLEVIDTSVLEEGESFLKAVEKINNETESLLEQVESEDLHNVD